MNQASFPELGAYLVKRRAEIMVRWKELVCEQCLLPAAAHELSDEQFEDHLPALTMEIVEALCRRPTTGVDEKASQHGHERRQLGYSLQEVICELWLFRQVLLDAVDSWLDATARSLSSTEVRAATSILMSLVDQSVSTSAQRYAEDAEQERNEANRELAERTRQLELHSRRLEALDAEKDRFLAMLSHELRNPIAPILSAAYILKQADLAPKYAHSRDVIERQARHLTRLVDDLLEVNRMLVGKIELKKEPCDLVEAVQQAVEVCTGAFEAKSIAFKLHSQAQRVTLFADPTRIVQILTNLLANAAKFTRPNGHVSLTIEPQDGFCICRLEDDGIGIAPEVLPIVFDLFAQADTSMDRSFGGLGVGLALAKNLVEAHGGSIRAESQGLEKGATFTLRLPTLGHQEMTSSVLPGLPRVAVVEDNPDSRLLMAEVLETKGFTVVTANDGIEALKIAEEVRPQAYVIDLGLPGMNGYEVAKQLRKLEGNDHQALLVALTGYGRPEDKKRAEQAGFDYHMTKPADFDSLERMLRAGGKGTYARSALH